MVELEVSITPTDKKQIDNAENYLRIAKDFTIDDETSFILANATLKEIKRKKNEFDGMRKHLKKPINAAGKAIEELFREPLHFLGQAESIYKVNLVKYHKQIDAQNTQSTQQHIIKTEELTANALEALKSNDHETYATLMQEISKVSSRKILSLANTDGVSFKDNWKGRVVDFEQVIQAVIEKKIPITVLKIDEPTLHQLARSTKNTVAYPGIEFYNDKIVSVKTGKAPC